MHIIYMYKIVGYLVIILTFKVMFVVKNEKVYLIFNCNYLLRLQITLGYYYSGEAMREVFL